jgi:hypothetical protein
MRTRVLLAAVAAAALAATAAHANVTTNIYSGHSNVGGGEPYTGFVGSLSTPGVSFGADTGFNWHPFGLGSFGADVMGTITAPATQDYTFHLSSDDGALLFIDGSLFLDRGGPHSPTTTDGTIHLTGGGHSFEIQFFECCGGPSGLDFSIPTDVSISSAPEPATWALAISGFALAGAGLRRRRRVAA